MEYIDILNIYIFTLVIILSHTFIYKGAMRYVYKSKNLLLLNKFENEASKDESLNESDKNFIISNIKANYNVIDNFSFVHFLLNYKNLKKYQEKYNNENKFNYEKFENSKYAKTLLESHTILIDYILNSNIILALLKNVLGISLAILILIPLVIYLVYLYFKMSLAKLFSYNGLEPNLSFSEYINDNYINIRKYFINSSYNIFTYS